MNSFAIALNPLSRPVLVICLLLLCAFASGQAPAARDGKKIQLVHANSLEKTKDIEAKRLLGNVEFEHNGVHMYCDSAYLFDDNSLHAYSNVHIRQGDSLHLYGDFLKYNGNERKAEVQKNIRMTDRDMTLTTDFITYDLKESLATYTTGGKIVNKDNTLTSQYGYYYSNSRMLAFKKNVVLTNPQYVMNCDTLLYNVESKVAYFEGPTTIKSSDNIIYCENGFYDTNRDVSQFNRNAYIVTREQRLKGDSLYYDRKKGYGKAMRNVSIRDSAQNIYITGNLAEHYEESENSIVTGNAVLMQQFDGDTLYLHADTLRSAYANDKGIVRSLPARELAPVKGKNKKDKKEKNAPKAVKPDLRVDTLGYPHRVLFAYHKVKFFKEDMQGKCDSLVYSYLDSTMRLYKLPVIWSDQNQLTGEQMSIGISGGKIRSMEMRNTAFIASQEDSARFNQIKGKIIRGYFIDNDLHKIRVEGNGQTIYFPKDKNSIIGVNKAVCSDILIYMKDNKVEKITFINQPEATLYPPNELTGNDIILEDFKWRGTERPMQKKDIFRK